MRVSSPSLPSRSPSGVLLNPAWLGPLVLGLWACAPSTTTAPTPTPSPTPAPVTASCSDYCDEMGATCPEEAFFHDGACVAWCESAEAPLPPGTEADTAVDTLGCRLHWLEQAAVAANEAGRLAACSAAAASGGDVCGSWCDVYCRQGLAGCTADNPAIPEEFSWFEGEEDRAGVCQEVCAGFGRDVLAGISVVEQHFGYGETVQCRLHHQQAAMLEGPAQASAWRLHCGHAAPEPTELCTEDARPNSVNYCEFALDFCPDLFAPGATAADCRGQIDSLVDDGVYLEAPFASFADDRGPTLGCLNHHIMRAALDPAACAAADWDPAHWDSLGGEGVCSRP